MQQHYFEFIIYVESCNAMLQCYTQCYIIYYTMSYYTVSNYYAIY